MALLWTNAATLPQTTQELVRNSAFRRIVSLFVAERDPSDVSPALAEPRVFLELLHSLLEEPLPGVLARLLPQTPLDVELRYQIHKLVEELYDFWRKYERFLVERVVGATELTSLLLMFGVSILVTNLALYFWSADFRSAPYLTGSVRLGELALPQARLVAFGVALLLAGGAYVFLKRSTLGKAIRATSQHPMLALVCGIGVTRIRLLTFGLGSAMAGVAGSLLVTMYSVNPEMGQLFILKAFAIIALGGMGSFVGGLLGGLVLGLAEAYTGFFLSTQLAEAVAYMLLVLVLVFRPSGLLGARE
jgi:branched-chain amino acid transport system permease protein